MQDALLLLDAAATCVKQTASANHCIRELYLMLVIEEKIVIYLSSYDSITYPIDH
jgi:hypothetical protein